MPEMQVDRSIRWTWISAATTLVALGVALAGFFFTSSLKPSPKPSPTITPVAFSVTGALGVNLDTNPPTFGPPSTSSLTVAEAKNTANFVAKLPSSLAYITDDTSSPPSLSACEAVIAERPTLNVSVQDNGWVCIRTVAGATKAIHVIAINPPNIEMQAYALKN
jgi:hypothetical protein